YYVGISEVIEKSETDCSYMVSATGVVSSSVKCTNPKHYCALNWTKSSWKKGDPLPTASAGVTGTLYGKCQMLTTHDTNPIIMFSEGASLVYPKMKCRNSTQYCALNWTKSSWEKGETVPSAGAGASGVLYGKCQILTTFNVTPYFEQITGPNRIFKAEKKCPPKMYCNLQWKDISCTAAGADITGRVYGACALWDEQNTTCPKPAE
ncbi:MAG: hypothetical protein IKZ02_06020, partial [Alphaproteobacteria bacterium]|nr:hypothetical protein [Alphaproteobacteria bacterium]